MSKMSKIIDFAKRWWPTIFPLVLLGLSAVDSTIQTALIEFAKAHPSLAGLAGAVWVAIANWVRGQKALPPPAA